MGASRQDRPSSVRHLDLALDERPVRSVPRHALAGRQVPPLVLDGPQEVRGLSAHAHVRPNLVRRALQYEVGPERRPDEPDAVAPDRVRVEEVDPRSPVRQSARSQSLPRPRGPCPRGGLRSSGWHRSTVGVLVRRRVPCRGGRRGSVRSRGGVARRLPGVLLAISEVAVTLSNGARSTPERQVRARSDSMRRRRLRRALIRRGLAPPVRSPAADTSQGTSPQEPGDEPRGSPGQGGQPRGSLRRSISQRHLPMSLRPLACSPVPAPGGTPGRRAGHAHVSSALTLRTVPPPPLFTASMGWAKSRR